MPAALDAALVAAGVKAVAGPWKRPTVEHRLSVLAGIHRGREQPNPCEAPAVRQVLKSARRAGAQRGETPTKKAALTREPLEAMLATCDDSLEGLRDRALLLFGFASGGRRRSEIAAAQLHQLQRVDATTYVFQMGASKTDQAGTRSSHAGAKPVVGRAAAALTAWLTAANLSEGAVFRRLWGTRVGGGLSPAAVGALIQRRARRAGLEAHITGHSLRAGFITEAGRRQVPLAEVMALSGHRTLLADRYHVVAPDLPGFGLTEAPAHVAYVYTFDRLATTMNAFTRVLGLEHYAMQVFDYGAPVGWRLAAAHPERITAIVTQNGNAYEEGLSEGWNPIQKY